MRLHESMKKRIERPLDLLGKISQGMVEVTGNIQGRFQEPIENVEVFRSPCKDL